MIDYRSLAMADISEVTRPRSYGQAVDTRVIHAPAEPQPDYDRMREMVHGSGDKAGNEQRIDERRR